MMRHWFAVCLITCQLIGAAAAQATLTVNAPPDRLALPGAYVTLVYQVVSSTAGQARIQVTSMQGYALLTPPGSVVVQAGVPLPVPVTVAIPANAPALAVEQVTMVASMNGARSTSTVRVTVGATRGLRLQVPAKIPLAQGSIPFKLVNRGNVEEDVTLKVRHANGAYATKSVTLAAAETVPVDVPVQEAGSYEAELIANGKVQARAFVQVVKEGVPQPPPITLHAEVNGTLDTSLGWSLSAKVQGPLSDYLTTTAVMLADQPVESYWNLNARQWTATLGSVAHGTLDLPVPDEPGLLAALRAGKSFLGAAATYVGADRFSGYAFSGRNGVDDTVAAAAGIHAGEPMATYRLAAKRGSTTWTTSGSFLDGTLQAQADVSKWDPILSATSSFSVQASDVLASDGMVHVGAAYGNPAASVWGGVDVPTGAQSVWGGRLGLYAEVPTRLPGRVYLNMQGGSGASYATLNYAVRFASGWHTSDHVGLTEDSNGFGVRVATSWAYAASPRNSALLLADVTYHPFSGIASGQLSGRYATAIGPASVSLTGGWNLTNNTADVGLAAVWNTGGAQLQAIADGGFDLTSRALTVTMGLSATVDFDILVPPAVIAVAGGRRLGTLAGKIAVRTAGIPDVTLHVGSYVVHTDADGTFSVQLKPGRWHVSVDLSTLPIEYRIDGPLEKSVAVEAHRTTHADFRAVTTAAITGRVLLDSNGDGVADNPPQPGTGTVLLTDSAGLSQNLAVGSDGTFAARGLLPGPARLSLAGLPLGATVEGGQVQTVAIHSGEVTRVTLLEVPAIVSAPTFSPTSLRIRAIHTEVDRVPPGASPIVQVTVQGHADRVALRIGRSTLGLAYAHGVWSGRVPVPTGSSPGVLRFDVVATSETQAATRQGQLIVDPTASLVVTTVPPTSVAGKPFEVQLSVYADASSITIVPTLGRPVEAKEVAPGRWVASLTPPADAKPGVYVATYNVTTTKGRTVRGTFQFRIGAP